MCVIEILTNAYTSKFNWLVLPESQNPENRHLFGLSLLSQKIRSMLFITRVNKKSHKVEQLQTTTVSFPVI